MTDDFTELDNVGTAREEKLNTAGYETYADLAEAEPADLTDEVARMPEDSALEVVVQAQNLAELEDAEVEENPDTEPEPEPEPEPSETVTVEGESEPVEGDTVNVTEKVVEADDTGEDEAEDEPEDTGDPTHELRLEMETVNQYHTMYACLLQHRRKLIGTNQSGVSRVEDVLEQLQGKMVGDELVMEMAGGEINDLHNALLQYRLDCQGKNMNEFLAAARSLESRFNNERERLLF